MFFNKKTKQTNQQSENPYRMSFSDMMSGMLIVFILLCITLILRLSQMEEEWQKRSHKLRKDIFYEIKESLDKYNIKVFIDENDSVLHIPSDYLGFPKRESIIQNEYKQTAKNIGCALYLALTKEQRWQELETVFIEGHADGTPFGEKDIGNWKLSTDRAVALWRFWITDMETETCGEEDVKGVGPQLETMTNFYDKNLFSISGYGATRQIKNETGLAGEELKNAQDANRRIDIRITTRQPTIAEIRSGAIKTISK